MPQQQILHRQAAGLISNKNPLFAEEGSLTAAENVVSDREGVLSIRRGFSRYAFANSQALGEFRGHLVVLDNLILKIDDGLGNLSVIGVFSPPAGARMRFEEVGKALYFTTSQGVMKLDALPSEGGIASRAGMPPGLDVQVSLSGSSGWFPDQRQVAYRVVWVRVDKNGKVVTGAPSWRVILVNAGGGSRTVSLVSSIPMGVFEGDFYEVYRTEISADVSSSPGDEMFKLARVAVTATDIVNGAVVFFDTFDEIYLGAALSTNASEDGELQEHSRPPYCTDLADYRGYLHFCGDLKYEPRLELQLLDVAGITPDVDSITISRENATRTYTFSTSQNNATHKFKLETGLGSVSLNIRATMENLCQCVNRDVGNIDFWCLYSSKEDDPPGKVLILDRSVNVGAFTLTATPGVSVKFSPSVPDTGLQADPMSFPNGLAFSRFEEPDHVPEQNRDLIGSTSAILRFITLTTSGIILKEDGVWRRTGDTDATFFDFPVDKSIRIVCRDAAALLDNQVYCASLAGLVRISDAGVGIISWPIDVRLKRVFSFTNYQTISFAVAYPSDFKYIFWTQEAGGDTHCKIGWVWNHLTSRWSTWLKEVTCGHVLTSTDNLYLGHAVDSYVLRERKSYNTSLDDFKDESIPITITGINGKTVDITYSYSTPLADGFVLEQPSRFQGSSILVVTPLGGTAYRVTVEELLPALQVGAAVVSLPIPALVHWKPEPAANPAVSKHWLTTQLYFEDEGARHFDVGWFSDIDGSIRWYPRTMDSPVTGWGIGGWGERGWGDPDPQRAPVLRSSVPTPYERSRTLTQTLRTRYAKERWSLLDLAVTFEATGEVTTVR